MSLISQITALAQAIGDDIQTLLAHASNTSNPHSVDKTDVGLGNVDNTSDLSKPISTATQTALDDKQNEISGSVLTSATVSGTDKVLIQDADDSDNLKTVTAQSIADLGGGGGGSGKAAWYIGGVWYASTSNHWYSFHQWYGGFNGTHSQAKGTGATPDYSSSSAPAGVFLPSGTKVIAAYFGGRRNNTELTGVRLYLRAERDFDTIDKSWTDEIDDTTLNFTGSQLTDISAPFVVKNESINYTTDRDCMLIPFVKSIGTLTGTRYYYASLTVILEYP